MQSCTADSTSEEINFGVRCAPAILFRLVQVPELRDTDDVAIAGAAAVSIGYHDPQCSSTCPAPWSTADGH
eukprot:2982162-Pleurochrysis_carterae.AAC.1